MERKLLIVIKCKRTTHPSFNEVVVLITDKVTLKIVTTNIFEAFRLDTSKFSNI